MVVPPRPVRWAARHGVFRLLLARAARTGDLDARLALDPALLADPFSAYDEVRARGAFSHGPLALSTARYDVCTAVLRSEALGVQLPAERRGRPARVLQALAGPGVTPVEPPSMLAVDPPDHTRYRRPVARVFGARSVEALRARVEQTAQELLDGLAADREVDLVARYATVLPVTVISQILGVPDEMRETFLRWGDGAAATLDVGLRYREFRRAERDLAALHAWMLEHFARLRRAPAGSLLGQLVALADAEGVLDEAELASVAMLLLGAGFETTVNLLTNGVAQLLAHPRELDLLREDTTCWPNAVEEVLRLDSPVQRTGRVARTDTEVAGVPIRAGSFVVLLLGGANRDPAVFTDPGRLDVRRPNARDHLAFSSGVHYCLGAALARLEGEVGLRRLVERYPDLSLAGVPHRRALRVLRGYDRMPVRLGAPGGPSARASLAP